MRGRFLLGLLLAVTVVAGYPYAGLLLGRIIGTSTVTFSEHDGIQRTMVMGPDAPRPEWLPILPRSVVVQAAHWLPSPGREVAGSVELLTHKSVDEVKRYYLYALRAAGFDVRDAGFGPINAATAAYMGIDNTLLGWRADTSLWISVTTRTPGGLFVPSRTVQINWQKRDAPMFGVYDQAQQGR
jgi:hypothetical protein